MVVFSAHPGRALPHGKQFFSNPLPLTILLGGAVYIPFVSRRLFLLWALRFGHVTRLIGHPPCLHFLPCEPRPPRPQRTTDHSPRARDVHFLKSSQSRIW